MFATVNVNWLGIVVATAAVAAIGAIYFMLLIPKWYAIALGRVGAPAAQTTLLSRLLPVVCILTTNVTSAVLIAALGISSLAGAASFGLIVGIGYLTAMTFNIANNPNFPRPLLYGLINAPFFIIGSVLSSIIIVALD